MRTWISFNSSVIACLISLVIFVPLYYHFSKSYRKVDLQTYTEKVELISIEHKTIQSLPEIYPTKSRIDKILFNVEYVYEGVRYNSIINVYWEYITPDLENVIFSNELEKLIIKCKKESPGEAMVFANKGELEKFLGD